MLADAEQSAAERLSHEIGALDARLVLRDRGRQLLLRDDLRERRRLRQAEEDEQRPFDERDDDDLCERELVECERDREAPERERASSVGDDHRALAVPAVDERSGRKVEEDVGQRLREPDDAGLRRRARLGEDEQRIGDAGDAGTDRGDDLPAPQHYEVAVTPERRVSYRRRPFLARSIWRFI